MKKALRITWVLALLLMVAGADAQKIDQRLTRLVEQSGQRRAQGVQQAAPKYGKLAVDYNEDGTVKMISAIATLKDGMACPTAELEAHGIRVRLVTGNTAVLAIPASALQALEQMEAISYVQADTKLQLMNDKTREANKVNSVNTPAAAAAQGLPQAYTGKGVVLGIVDIGIDFNHRAFRNADGSTRIKKAYLYNDWNGLNTQVATTEEEIMALTTDRTDHSHGTHTAATAAGSDAGNGWQGMAPEADLVLVGLGKNANTSNSAEAIKNIFDYAESVGKPCVISISMGEVLGLHDGSDSESRLIEELTNKGTKAGRTVLYSSANAAANYQSIIHTLGDPDADGYQLRTVWGAEVSPQDFSNNLPIYKTTVGLFAYAADGGDFTIDLKLLNIETGATTEVNGHLYYDKNMTKPAVIFNDKKSIPNLKGNTVVTYSINFGETDENAVYIDNAKLRLALFVKGDKGRTLYVMGDGDSSQEPNFLAPVGLEGYTQGWGDFAFNRNICNDGSISVGAYVANTSWTDYTGESYNMPKSTLLGRKQEIGEIVDFSSYGIDDTGRAHPVVLGPGQRVRSAFNSYDLEYFTAAGEVNADGDPMSVCQNIEANGRKNWYGVMDGTSMSCPAVAGSVVLWMQANPQLSTLQIKELMKETCVSDEFCTDTSKIPSNNLVQAGYGKMDVLAGLKKITGATGIALVGADGSREATPSTMYDVDAPVYNMMGQRVDKGQHGLVIYKGRKYMNR